MRQLSQESARKLICRLNVVNNQNNRNGMQTHKVTERLMKFISVRLRYATVCTLLAFMLTEDVSAVFWGCVGPIDSGDCDVYCNNSGQPACIIWTYSGSCNSCVQFINVPPSTCTIGSQTTVSASYKKCNCINDETHGSPTGTCTCTTPCGDPIASAKPCNC